MLFKHLVLQYGSFMNGTMLSDRIDPIVDIISSRGTINDLETLGHFRKEALETLQESKPYYLDHHAADMVDSFSAQLEGEGENFVRDIKLPHDVVWIEYDERALVDSRAERGNKVELDEFSYGQLNERGVLFDNRRPEYLRVISFSKIAYGHLIDPFSEHHIYKGQNGRLDIGRIQASPIEHSMTMLRLGPGVDEAAARAAVTEDIDRGKRDLLLGYALFSLIDSRPEDVTSRNGTIFSAKEQKTARKFGKSHIAAAPSSHVTISLTEPAKEYIQDLRDDFRASSANPGTSSGRARHKVKAHFRRYKSGKIVLVKSHFRGSEVDRRPVRVTASEEDTPTP